MIRIRLVGVENLIDVMTALSTHTAAPLDRAIPARSRRRHDHVSDSKRKSDEAKSDADIPSIREARLAASLGDS